MEYPFIQTYTDILKEEIVPVNGCTDPISIAYCAAKAHSVLGMQPTAATVSVSANVLKNVKSVVVPHTNGMKGIRAAVAAGVICGDADKGIRAIGTVTDEQRKAIEYFLASVHIDVSCAETDCPLYISVTLFARTSYSRVVIANSHTNIVEIMKNGEELYTRPIAAQADDDPTDRTCLNLHDILTYADTVDLSDDADLLHMQIAYNTAICEEGLNGDYGANIGRILLADCASDAKTRAKAYAAAGSDARMGGSELPVAGLCGSGSLGIAATAPIVCYAKHFTVPEERMYRALLVADLLTVYLKTWDKRSSASCGAVNAGCAAGAGIAYLLGGDENTAARTLVHAIDLSSDVACGGAGSSCALKIAAAVETGILGYQAALHQQKEHGADDLRNADAAVRRIAPES